MAYDNTNSGMLAKNERRREGKKDPEYSGSVNVEGKEYWIKAWINEGKEGGKMEGKKYFSLALDPKDDQGNNGGGNRSSGGNSSRSSSSSSRSSSNSNNNQGNNSNRGGNNNQGGGSFDDMDDDIPF